MSLLASDLCCLFCNLPLAKIFIRCQECFQHSRHANIRNNYICLGCFSNGLENDFHKNFHDYKVINLERIETFDNWNALNELELVNKIHKTEGACLKRNAESNTTYNPQLNFKNYSHDDCVRHIENWFDLIQNSSHNFNFSLNETKVYENRLKSSMILLKEINLNNNDLSSIGIKNNINTIYNLTSVRPMIHSKQYRQMNGYRPARGDFETEFNDKFELKHVADLDVEHPDNNIQQPLKDEDSIDDYKTEIGLKLSILKSYNDLIKERLERKKFIHDFGLLNELVQNEYTLTVLNKNNQSQSQGFVKSLERFSNIEDNLSHLNKLGGDLQSNWSLPLKFQRLFKNFESYIKCVELFNHQAYLKKRLEDLKEFRSNGLKSLKNVSIYKNLKFKRLNRVSSVHMGSLLTSINRFDDCSSNSYNRSLAKTQCLEWFKKFVITEKNLLDKKPTSISVAAATGSNSTSSPSAYPMSHLKYKNNPLKIENYPENDKLDEDEKEFCRVARVQPTVYLRVKTVLVLENNKAGFCTYSRARKIAGIDVNKTRLIHNLLLKLELIRANDPKDVDFNYNDSSNT